MRGDGARLVALRQPRHAPVRAVSVAARCRRATSTAMQAGEACPNAGKRLCTDAEWLRACQGPDETTYPYGNTREPGVCNDHRDVHPAVEYFGTSASWIFSHDRQRLHQPAPRVARAAPARAPAASPPRARST